MSIERKIKAVVRQVTFAEAENADDEYWANASEEERLQELIELRRIVFGDAEGKIKKVVSRRNIYDEED
jgi:E3 ubiquitin-protein ligase DOA10